VRAGRGAHKADRMVIKDPWIRALVIVVLAIAVLFLAGLVWQLVAQFADIILLFFLAWVIAFILEPVVVFLRLHGRLPRPLAVTVAYLGLLILSVGGIVWLVLPLSGQVVQVALNLPAYASFATEQLVALQDALDERGIAVNLTSLVNYEDLVRRVETVAPPILFNAGALATRIASFLLQLAIVLILSFYVMLDGHRISQGLLRSVPVAFREDVVFFFASVNRAFAGFLRGQLVQALIYALGVAAIMSAFGLNLVLLTTVVNTLLMLIPFVGPPLALIMPIVIAFVEKPGSFWIIFLMVNVLQQIVLNVVAPRVMSTAIGLHPLLVFVGLLGGAQVAGVWGALFGVPVVAVVTAMVSFYHAMLEQRRGVTPPVAPIEPQVTPKETTTSPRQAVVRRPGAPLAETPARTPALGPRP
jgi:predicted PurR-regulated permease PerM